jgi:hypothetical protein
MPSPPIERVARRHGEPEPAAKPVANRDRRLVDRHTMESMWRGGRFSRQNSELLCVLLKCRQQV